MSNGYIEVPFMLSSQKPRQLPAMGLQNVRCPCTTNNLKGESPAQCTALKKSAFTTENYCSSRNKDSRRVWFVQVT